MLKEALTGFLRMEHRIAGLFLEELEDIVMLKKEGQEKSLAEWPTSTVTLAMIRKVADKILEKEKKIDRKRYLQKAW